MELVVFSNFINLFCLQLFSAVGSQFSVLLIFLLITFKYDDDGERMRSNDCLYLSKAVQLNALKVSEKENTDQAERCKTIRRQRNPQAVTARCFVHVPLCDAKRGGSTGHLSVCDCV